MWERAPVCVRAYIYARTCAECVSVCDLGCGADQAEAAGQQLVHRGSHLLSAPLLRHQDGAGVAPWAREPTHIPREDRTQLPLLELELLQPVLELGLRLVLLQVGLELVVFLEQVLSELLLLHPGPETEESGGEG